MKEMIQYVKRGNKVKVKDRNGNIVEKHTKKRGIMIAIPKENKTLLVGWSMCNLNSGDRFNKKDAYERAYGRGIAYKYDDRNFRVPQSIENDFFYFVKRAIRYFKGQKAPKWVCEFYGYDFNNEDFGYTVTKTNVKPKINTPVHTYLDKLFAYT